METKKVSQKFTKFCETLGIWKLSKRFVDKLDLREEEEVFPDVIRKLGFKNSWSSYFDLWETE
jgi:hypothetical protein